MPQNTFIDMKKLFTFLMVSLSIGAFAQQNAGALHFDGVNDYIQIKNSTALSQREFTFEFWFRPENQVLQIGSLGSLRANSAISGGWNVYYTNNNRIQIWNGYTAVISPSMQLQSFQWYHLAFVSTDTGQVLYLDGDIIGSTSDLVNPLDFPYDFTIGRVNEANQWFYKGAMDEIRYWNAALDSNTIRSRMNTELNGTEDNLYFNFRLNQGVANDSNLSEVIVKDEFGCLNAEMYNFNYFDSTSNWVSGNPALTAVSHSVSGPDMTVSGNGVDLINGVGTPSLINNTYLLNKKSVDFKISNTGGYPLIITGIALSGNYPSSFEIAFNEPVFVEANSDYFFELGYNPTDTIYKDAVISIYTNNCPAAEFEIHIAGKLDNVNHAGNFFNGYGATQKFNLAPTNHFTYEAWVFSNDIQNSFAGIIYTRGDSTIAGLNVINGNRLGYTWDNDHFMWQGGPIIPSQEWVHVALVIEPEQATIYLNGEGYTNVATHNTQIFDTNTFIAADPFSVQRLFFGRIDELRFWNKARTCDEIVSTMNSRLTGNEDSLIAYFDFDKGAPNGNLVGDTIFSKGSEFQLRFAILQGTGNRFARYSENYELGLYNTTALAMPNADVTQNDSLLSANYTEGLSYQWINCETDQELAGETSPTFVATQSGQYKVRIVNQLFPCEEDTLFSECYTVTITGGGNGDTTGIKELEVQGFVMYPNPANTFVTIANVAEQSTITIFDISGRVVFAQQATKNQLEIETANWQNGMYVVVLQNATKIEKAKLIISK